MSNFDPHKSFLSLPILWLTIGGIFFLAVIIFLVIFLNSNLVWRGDFEGFNNFVTYFKFPLGILALIIPIVALLAANHRSEQTRAQISSSNQQNQFSNYYKHIEEFVKYFEKRFVAVSQNEVHLPRSVHKVLFPYARKGVYVVDPFVVEILKDECGVIVSILESFGKKSDVDIYQKLADIERRLIGLEVFIGSAFPGGYTQGIVIDGVSLKFKNGKFVSYFVGIKDRINYLLEILLFDQDFEIPYSCMKLRSINTSEIPDVKFNYMVSQAPVFNVFTDKI